MHQEQSKCWWHLGTFLCWTHNISLLLEIWILIKICFWAFLAHSIFLFLFKNLVYCVHVYKWGCIWVCYICKCEWSSETNLWCHFQEHLPPSLSQDLSLAWNSLSELTGLKSPEILTSLLRSCVIASCCYHIQHFNWVWKSTTGLVSRHYTD